jgi:hypothetical protein
VASPGIEPGSGASETLILSIVLRGRGFFRSAKVSLKAVLKKSICSKLFFFSEFLSWVPAVVVYRGNMNQLPFRKELINYRKWESLYTCLPECAMYKAIIFGVPAHLFNMHINSIYKSFT